MREPIEFVYNETGELWEDKMGIDFMKEDWYDDIVEIQSRLYSNASKFALWIGVTNRTLESDLEKFWKEYLK